MRILRIVAFVRRDMAVSLFFHRLAICFLSCIVRNTDRSLILLRSVVFWSTVAYWRNGFASARC